MAVVLRAKAQKHTTRRFWRRSRLTQEERDWLLLAAQMIEHLEKEVEQLRPDNA